MIWGIFMVTKVELLKFTLCIVLSFIVGIEVGFILDSGDYFNRKDGE